MYQRKAAAPAALSIESQREEETSIATIATSPPDDASSSEQCLDSISTPAARRSKSQFNPELQRVQTLEDRLTFFQRYFTKPILHHDKEVEKRYNPENRRFAFTSVGFLVSASAMVVVLLAAIAAAVAVTVENHKRVEDRLNHPSPIRAAIQANFPDPAIWYANGIWYAYATNSGAGVLGLDPNKNVSTLDPTFGIANIQMATSTDFINWTVASVDHEPLPLTGNWAMQPNLSRAWTPEHPGPVRPGLASGVWAPGIIQRPSDNRFVMYYAAVSNQTNPKPMHPRPHCVGAAVSASDSPTGPYTPVNSTLACPVDQGGAIDAEAYMDTDGTIYAVWKVDGNNIGNGGVCGNTVDPIVPTPIMLQKMQSDGITGVGDAVQILDRIDSDGPLIEAPMLVRSENGTYFLFFSSGCTRTPSYAIKYATATNITGPYTRAENALLQTGDWGLEAPGSVGVHSDGNGTWYMAFHARVKDGDQGGVRAMFTTQLELDGNMVRMIRGNTTSPMAT